MQIQKSIELDWRSENVELSAKLDLFLSRKLPDINYDGIQVKYDIATRTSSSVVLSLFAKQIDNMIVPSADLSNSDKTDGFLKKRKVFQKDDFTGKF